MFSVPTLAHRASFLVSPSFAFHVTLKWKRRAQVKCCVQGNLRLAECWADTWCLFEKSLHILSTFKWLLCISVCPHRLLTSCWPPPHLPVLAPPLQKRTNDSSAPPITNQTQEALRIFDPLWTIMRKVQDKYFPSPLISDQTLPPLSVWQSTHCDCAAFSWMSLGFEGGKNRNCRGGFSVNVRPRMKKQPDAKLPKLPAETNLLVLSARGEERLEWIPCLPTAIFNPRTCGQTNNPRRWWWWWWGRFRYRLTFIHVGFFAAFNSPSAVLDVFRRLKAETRSASKVCVAREREKKTTTAKKKKRSSHGAPGVLIENIRLLFTITHWSHIVARLHLAARGLYVSRSPGGTRRGGGVEGEDEERNKGWEGGGGGRGLNCRGFRRWKVEMQL